MSRVVRRIGLAVLLVAAAVALAQEPPETPDPDAGQPAESIGRNEASPGQDAEPSEEDFVPSERIPADASIAFPVDI